jgi:hypothetical protein
MSPVGVVGVRRALRRVNLCRDHPTLGVVGACARPRVSVVGEVPRRECSVVREHERSGAQEGESEDAGLKIMPVILSWQEAPLQHNGHYR